MRGISVVCAWALLLPGINSAAQDKTPDFSGRWVLVDAPASIPSEPDTLKITASDELAITQTPLAITIRHSSNPGTHPVAGKFEFGVGSTVAPAGGADSRWGVSWFGTQLIISNSTTSAPNANGRRITIAHGSIWRLDRDGRLIIEFGERRTGADPKDATRVYVRSDP